jgi:hypothetical protein
LNFHQDNLHPQLKYGSAPELRKIKTQ